MAKIAILGFGTVGSGVYEVLCHNAASVSRRAGEPVEVKYILDPKDFTGNPVEPLVVKNIDVILQDPEIQVVVETMASLTTLDKKFADGSPITVDDNAVCIYRMSGGAVGTMTASWTNYGPEDNSTVINGTEGALRIYDDPAHTLVLIHRDGTVENYDVDQIQTNDHQTKSGIIDLFVDCLNDPSHEGISAESVLPAMRAVFASIVSSETGRAVRVNE